MKKTKTVTLLSGKECTISLLSVDDYDYCEDLANIQIDSTDTNKMIVVGISKQSTALIRRGLQSCKSLKSFKLDKETGHVSDETIRAFTQDERLELAKQIKEFNTLGESNASA